MKAAYLWTARTARRTIGRIRSIILCVSLLSIITSIPTAAQNQESIDLPGDMFNSLQSTSEANILEWLREGGDPDTVLDGDGNTFMHYAATNLLHILQEAVRRGGDCNRKNSHGATPLHFAASQDSLGPGAEALRILVRCEASPNVRRACASGDRMAEHCRADPNAQDRRGNTPLHTIYEGVEKSAHPPVRNLGTTGLKDTGGGTRADVLRVLLEEVAADPNIPNRNGDTPLMLLVRSGHAAFSRPGHVSHLLKHNADPDTRNNKGATPLIQTVSLFSAVRDDDDSPRIVALLVKHGADPDLRDGRGDTPLIRAAQHEDDSVFEIEALLAGGADPCLRDRNGSLAYDHARPDGAMALHKAGGYPDRETGICVRDLLVAEEREKNLGLDRDQRRRLQSCLKTAGFDPGAPDGLFGPRTRAAVRAWQAAQGGEGIEAAGYFALAGMDALLESCRTAAPEPLCSGQKGSGCWMEVTNHSGCYIWNPNPQPEETVTWSGGCVDGRVSGKGRATWRFREDGRWKSSWNEESYLEGKPSGNGHVVHQNSAGHEFEGPQVNGKAHGHWVERYADGQVWEGPYVNGQSHGVWVRRDDPHTPQQCWQRNEHMEGVGGFAACGFLDAEETMQAVSPTDLRLGPGDAYTLVGRLEVGQEVGVGATSDEWVFIGNSDGTVRGYVRASALVAEPEKPEALAVVTVPRCGSGETARNDSGLAYCWAELSHPPGCLAIDLPNVDAYVPVSGSRWSGTCVQGLANGKGTLTHTHSRSDEYGHFRLSYEATGIFLYGKPEGTWKYMSTDDIENMSQGRVYGTLNSKAHSTTKYIEGIPDGEWTWEHNREERKFRPNWSRSTKCDGGVAYSEGVIQSHKPGGCEIVEQGGN